MGRDHVIVAKKTFLHLRDTRILGPLDEGMAEAAVDLLYPRMDAVAERDRLVRSYPKGRIEAVEEEQDCEQECLRHPTTYTHA